MKTLAFRSLMWVLYAKKPLRTEELQDALATDEAFYSRDNPDFNSIGVILEACANILVEEEHIIRPTHFSAQEFLAKSPLKDLQSFGLEKIQAPIFVQESLALTCIFHLQIDVLRDGPCYTWLDLAFRLRDNPFVWYASNYFDHHAQSLHDVSPRALSHLEALIHLDSSVLAAVLQIRQIRHKYDTQSIERDFDNIIYTVDTNTIIYSTQLYGMDVFKEKLSKRRIPKYALHNAVANGFLPAVIGLIDVGCSIDEKDAKGRTPLFIAAAEGHTRIAEVLLNAEAMVNKKAGDCGSALQAASSRGNTDIVELLVDNGAEVNTYSGKYHSELRAAASKGNNNIVRLLLDRGADVNMRDETSGDALQTAVLGEGGVETVKLLLDGGAKINAQCGHYETAIQAAAHAGDGAIFALLLHNAADVNTQGGRYGNALQAASHIGDEAIVKLLLDRGAEVNAQGGLGEEMSIWEEFR